MLFNKLDKLHYSLSKPNQNKVRPVKMEKIMSGLSKYQKNI